MRRSIRVESQYHYTAIAVLKHSSVWFKLTTKPKKRLCLNSYRVEVKQYTEAYKNAYAAVNRLMGWV